MKSLESSIKTTILLIDDQPDNLAILVKYLEGIGYEIVVAQNGESGLARAEYVQPDLILLDVLMPGIDGFETCRRLKEEKQTREIPVIFMTALAAVEEKVRGFEAGGVDYITKPVQLDEARERIKTHLTISRLQKELQDSEEKYRRLVEGAPAVVYSFSDKRGGIFYSKGVEKILGYPVSDLYENPYLWNESIHRDDIPRIKQCIEEFASGKNFKVEYRIKDAQGKWRWLRDLSIGRIVQGDEIIIEGIGYDVTSWKDAEHECENLLIELKEKNAALGIEMTERRQAGEQLQSALKEKDVLMHEILHRTKNNMASIVSLLHLQSDRIGDDQLIYILTDIENRVHSMLLVQQQLYQSNDFTNLDLREYFMDLADKIFRNLHTGGRELSLRFDLESVIVPPDIAIPCGLILNELLTNALKYAFPGDKEGEIHIVLHSRDSGEIELGVRDNGVGIAKDFDFTDTDSLGLRLVMSFVDQLDGSIELKRDKGADWQIRFKNE